MFDQGIGPADELTVQDRLWAALAYFPNLVVVPVYILVTDENKARDFQRYHAIQALGVAGLFSVYAILLSLVYCVLEGASNALGSATRTIGIGFVGSGVAIGVSCLIWVLEFLPLAAALYLAYRAYSGKIFEIPVLTGFMRRQNWL